MNRQTSPPLQNLKCPYRTILFYKFCQHYSNHFGRKFRQLCYNMSVYVGFCDYLSGYFSKATRRSSIRSIFDRSFSLNSSLANVRIINIKGHNEDIVVDIKDALKNLSSGIYILTGYSFYQQHFGYVAIGGEYLGCLISAWQWDNIPKTTFRGLYGKTLGDLKIIEKDFNYT
jgi:hypothetical protein